MNDLTYEVTFTYNIGDEFFTEKIEREVDIDWFENSSESPEEFGTSDDMIEYVMDSKPDSAEFQHFEDVEIFGLEYPGEYEDYLNDIWEDRNF